MNQPDPINSQPDQPVLPSASFHSWTPDTLQQATDSLDGHWHVMPADNFSAQILLTDTRQLASTDSPAIFLALVGDRFDGHDFLHKAVQQGAKALVVEKPDPSLSCPQLVVSDTRKALGLLGAYRRKQCPHLCVLALTGSSGKTTVKNLLCGMFEQAGMAKHTLVTQGNLNNDLGVPMMLLRLQPIHRFAVLELGANHLQEIAYTTQLAKPNVAGVINIGTAHIGEFGGRANIASAKAEIYQGLSAEGTAILPYDDDYLNLLRQQANAHTSKTFGFATSTNNCANIWAQDIELQSQSSRFYLCTHEQKQLVHLSLPGAHNVSNAVAAAAFALAAGLSWQAICQGIEQATPTQGRLSHQRLGPHTLIDDTYNANPNAVRAAIDVLIGQAGTPVLVLGDVNELGDQAEQAHIEMGRYAAKAGVQHLLTYGAMAEHVIQGAKAAGLDQVKAYACKDRLSADLLDLLDAYQDTGATVLVKGSRGMQMETILQTLMGE